RLNPDVPPKLEDIINKALEKDRNLRYQHAADMRADLQRLKRDTDSSRSAVAAAEPVPGLAAQASDLGGGGTGSGSMPSGTGPGVVAVPANHRLLWITAATV